MGTLLYNRGIRNTSWELHELWGYGKTMHMRNFAVWRKNTITVLLLQEVGLYGKLGNQKTWQTQQNQAKQGLGELCKIQEHDALEKIRNAAIKLGFT